jgi:hypothetical protein
MDMDLLPLLQGLRFQADAVHVSDPELAFALQLTGQCHLDAVCRHSAPLEQDVLRLEIETHLDESASLFHSLPLQLDATAALSAAELPADFQFSSTRPLAVPSVSELLHDVLSAEPGACHISVAAEAGASLSVQLPDAGLHSRGPDPHPGPAAMPPAKRVCIACV